MHDKETERHQVISSAAQDPYPY